MRHASVFSGKDIHSAHTDALNKYMRNAPVEERLDNFVKEHGYMEKKYPATDLFKWHNVLTGSCEMGRLAFCRERGIDIEKDCYTVEEFVRMTANSYGSEVIRQLADLLSIRL